VAVPRRVARGTLSLLANRLVTLGVWFFLTPFMVNHLGHVTYGLWALIGSIVAYAALLDLGVAASVVKFVAEHRARAEETELQTMLASCLAVFLTLGALVVLAGAILAPFIPHLFNIPVDEQGTASWAVLVAAVNAGLGLPLSLPNAVLFGLQRLDLVALSAIASMSLVAGTTIAVLLLHGGLVVLMLSTIPVSLFGAGLSLLFVHRVAPEIRIGLHDADRRAISRLGSFSLPTFALEASGQLESGTDDIVIGAFLPVAAVGPYSVARRLSALPEVLSTQFSWALMPLASQFDAQDSRKRVSALLVTATRTALAGFLPIGLGVMVLGGRFLTAWIGPTFGNAGNIVIVLTCAALLYTTLAPGAVVSVGANRHRVLAVLAIGGAVLNLTLSIILIHPYGALGVALGTLIAAASRVAVSVPYLARIHGVEARRWFWSILLPAALPTLPAIATLLVLRATVDPTSVLSVLLVGVIGALVYVLAYLCMPSCTTERALIRHEFTRLLRPRSVVV
jgi:O-antigen/teichoic acid export membrane protein